MAAAAAASSAAERVLRGERRASSSKRFSGRRGAAAAAARRGEGPPGAGGGVRAAAWSSERREAAGLVSSGGAGASAGEGPPALYSQSRRAVEVYCNQEKPANPELLQRLQGVTSSLFMQRIIRLGGAVDDDMANVIVAQVRPRGRARRPAPGGPRARAADGLPTRPSP